MIWYMATQSGLSDTGGYAVHVEPLDGDIDQVVLKDQTVDIGLWPIKGADIWQSGRHVEETNVPRTARLKYGRSGGGPGPAAFAPPDLIGVALGQIVSRRLRDLIESQDPGVHQFLPLALGDASGKTVAGDYCWFAPGARVFALDAERTTPPLRRYKPTSDPVNPHPDREPMRRPPIPPKDMHPVFRKSRLGPFDVFCDGEFPNAIFVSDSVKTAYEDMGLTGAIFFGPHTVV